MYCTRCGAWMEERAGFCSACGQPAGSAVPGPPAVTAGPQGGYAGFWLRFAAWFIDMLILSAACLIVLVPLVPAFFHHRLLEPRMTGPFEQPMPGGSEAMLFMASWGLALWVLTLVGAWLYFALFESSSWQATPGKRALGLYVTDSQGRPISFARATGRTLGKIISGAILYIGFFMAGFTEKKQALHDMLADCLVLRRP